MLIYQQKKQKCTPRETAPMFNVDKMGADNGRFMPAYCSISLSNPMFWGLWESSQWADSNEPQVHRVWKRNDGLSRIYSAYLEPCWYCNILMKYYISGLFCIILALFLRELPFWQLYRGWANYFCAFFWQIKALYTISRQFCFWKSINYSTKMGPSRSSSGVYTWELISSPVTGIRVLRCKQDCLH